MMSEATEIQMANFRKRESFGTNGGMDLNIELQDLLTCIKHGQSTIRRPLRAKIPLVPPVLRNVESDKICYDPYMISIGPYHHGKLGLKEGEKLKNEMASQFFGRTERANLLYNSVLQVSKEARKYYVDCPDTSRFNDNEFTRIMFLDGCFLLQYMQYIKSEYHERLKFMSTHSIALVTRDLLLVENQLPTIVIDALLDHETCDPAKKSSYIYNFIMEIYGNRLNPNFEQCTSGLPEEMNQSLIHLLDIFRKMYLGPRNNARQNGDSDEYGQLEAAFFRSAKELQSIGVRFKVNPDFFPANICFRSHLIFAHLSLPRIIVDESTKAILLNMIAYEMCKEDDHGDYGVTDFICFMDSLIDHPDDVKLLRSSGVLYNGLGSDEQLADLFNHIAQNLIPSPAAYWTVKQRIQRRYKTKSSVWFAEMCHTYFNSPWAIITLFGALLLFFLTGTQTYFTVFPRGGK